MKHGVLGHRGAVDIRSGLGKHFRVYCQSGLFLDSDYTNINLIGLLITLLTIITINTFCHWRGHKAAAIWILARAVAASRAVLSTSTRVFIKLSPFWGIILSLFVNNFPPLPFLDRVSQPQSSRGGRNDLANDEGTPGQIDLRPRLASNINGQNL